MTGAQRREWERQDREIYDRAKKAFDLELARFNVIKVNLGQRVREINQEKEKLLDELNRLPRVAATPPKNPPASRDAPTPSSKPPERRRPPNR